MKDISLPKEAGVLCVSSRYIYIYLFIYLYFDFAKAFDSVSQDLILKNSKKYLQNRWPHAQIC